MSLQWNYGGAYRLAPALSFLLLLLFLMLRLVMFVIVLLRRGGRRDGGPITIAQMVMVLHLSHDR
jgi:hypothetical protein